MSGNPSRAVAPLSILLPVCTSLEEGIGNCYLLTVNGEQALNSKQITMTHVPISHKLPDQV